MKKGYFEGESIHMSYQQLLLRDFFPLGEKKIHTLKAFSGPVLFLLHQLHIFFSNWKLLGTSSIQKKKKRWHQLGHGELWDSKDLPLKRQRTNSNIVKEHFRFIGSRTLGRTGLMSFFGQKSHILKGRAPLRFYFGTDFFFFFDTPHGLQDLRLVPQPRMEPMPSAMKAWSSNHWTTRESPCAASFENILNERMLSRDAMAFLPSPALEPKTNHSIAKWIKAMSECH